MSKERSSEPRCTWATSAWSRLWRWPAAGRGRTLGHEVVAASVDHVTRPTLRRAGAVDADAAQLLAGRLRDLLAGKKILMTGVTGFIGEQLLWKILTDLPDTTPAVLVRRKRSAGARDRMIVRAARRRSSPTLRGRRRRVRGAAGQRIDVIEGDLPNVPALPADLDIVVHCAGDVSFDPPIDQAFTTNVLGTKALMDRMIEACTRRRRRPGQDPALRAHLHRLHRRPAPRRHPRGAARALDRLPGRDQGRAGDAGADRGRVPDLRPAHRAAQAGRARASAAGFLTTAADTERRRQEWVQAELVKAGTERARSLGWTDVYTFTKALGERVVADIGADIQVSVVRPGHRRVVLEAPVPGLDRGLQDGRAVDLGVRPRRAARVPGVAGLGGRHRAL